MSDNIKILKNYLIYFLLMVLVCIVGVSGVFADVISNYGTKYYYYDTSDDNSTTVTSYRYNENNYVTLDSGTAPTYNNSEGFNGFYNSIPYNIIKGNIYTINMTIIFENLQDSEFNRQTLNDRLLNINFAKSEEVQVTAVSGSYLRYNSTNQGVSGLYNFSVQLSYTVIATSTTDRFWLGTYTGDDRAICLNAHLYTSIVKVTSLSIEENNSSTIINQNDTIINQNQQMIEQNSQNTQEIINNNNTNTNNIINNQNQNTQEQIESQKVCETIIYNNNYDFSNFISGALNLSNGNVISAGAYSVSPFIPITNNSTISRSTYNNDYATRYCFYDTNKNYISCSQQDNISIPDNSYYFRFTITKNGHIPVYTIKSCKNGNQALNDSISGLNDSLNNDDTDGATSEASDFFSSFTTNTFGLTSIITAPLNLIQSLTSSTCTQLHLPLPYLNNKYLDLPCMTTIYQTHFGTFFTMYQTITYGIIAYWICVRIFNQVKDFKNPEHDEIEVVDL